MHLFAGSVGVANSMQYLVLLSGLASVHHGTPRRNYSFSLARMWLAKMEPAQNDTQNDAQTKLFFFSASAPGDRLVTQKAEQVVDVGSML